MLKSAASLDNPKIKNFNPGKASAS